MKIASVSRRVVSFVALSLCASCPSSAADPRDGAGDKAPAEAIVRDAVSPDAKATLPSAIEKKIAASFAATKLPAAAKAAYEKGFLDSYRTIIISPDVTTSRSGDKDDPGLIGFNDGIKAAKHDAPLALGDFSAIFEALGYKKQTVVGVYTAQFEQSDFVTDADNARWWLSATPYSGAVTPGHISVTALVSPKGSFGHFGSYEHQILILEVHAK